MLSNNRTIDWQKKETARASMRKMVKRLLKKYRYPPEDYDMAINTVISQCEMWVDNPMEAASYPEHDTKIYEYAVSGQNAKVADESSPYA